MQQKILNHIKANGGKAEHYSPKNIIASPNRANVKEYLYGNIDFATLKQRLGC